MGDLQEPKAALGGQPPRKQGPQPNNCKTLDSANNHVSLEEKPAFQETGRLAHTQLAAF